MSESVRVPRSALKPRALKALGAFGVATGAFATVGGFLQKDPLLTMLGVSDMIVGWNALQRSQSEYAERAPFMPRSGKLFGALAVVAGVSMVAQGIMHKDMELVGLGAGGLYTGSLIAGVHASAPKTRAIQPVQSVEVVESPEYCVTPPQAHIVVEAPLAISTFEEDYANWLRDLQPQQQPPQA